MSKNIPILMYHSIAKPPEGTAMKSLYVTPRNFYIQMHILKALGYTGLSMQQLEPYLRGEKHGKVVGITFDDGYENNLMFAAPILSKFGFGATCYIVSGKIGEYNSWDESKGIARNVIMNADQIRQWMAYDLDIGAHTCSHANLSELCEMAARLEIQESKNILESIAQKEVCDFCYPYGAYTSDTVDMVRQAGFTRATTIEKGLVGVPAYTMLELPRVFIAYRTLPHLFTLKLKGLYKP